MRVFTRLFFVLIALAFIGALLASQAARWLVVDDPQKSDVLVVLAGETSLRPARAIELLHQGMAPRALFDAEAGEQIYDRELTEIAQKYVDSLPEAKSITVCGLAGRSTAAETSDVARCLLPLGVHRVLLVTSEFHTRRALMIFSRRLPQYQWNVTAARNPSQVGVWWRDREWAKVIFDEWTKLIWWEAVDRWR
jgi:uncharacterized SAM-binding protein YcdF (DUF218 family)